MDEKTMASAKTVYKTLCDALDHREWHYEKDEEKLTVQFVVNGKDIPMQLIILIDPERQLIRLLSPFPFRMSEDKRMEGAVATCVATFNMSDGSFDYNYSNGQIVFRMTASFRDSLIGETLFQYMLSFSCAAVDAYNDKLLAIDKGLLSIHDFMADE